VGITGKAGGWGGGVGGPWRKAAEVVELCGDDSVVDGDEGGRYWRIVRRVCALTLTGELIANLSSCCKHIEVSDDLRILTQWSYAQDSGIWEVSPVGRIGTHRP
jgi:hypothetical protein